MADVVEDFNAYTKQVYPNGEVPDLVPTMAKFQKLVKFRTEDLLGDQYVIPVRLAYPNGFTHALGDGTAGAFSLNDAKAGTQKKAKMNGAQILLRDVMSYEDAKRCMKGKQAFVDGTSEFFAGLQKSVRKRVEVVSWYGGTGTGQGLATVGSYSNPTITVSTATWASGIWAGMEGAEVDIMNGASVRGTTTISSYDLDARTITLAADVSGTTAGDKIYLKGAYGKEATGVKAILANTGSLFSVDASAYNLWKGTSHAVGSAAFSFAELKKGLAKAVNKGLDEDLDLFLNPGAWNDLANNIESVRKTSDKEVQKTEIGTEEIVYHSQNGLTRIHSSFMIKEGDGFGICAADWRRIGACDVTFNDFANGGDIFFHLEGKAGVEARCYTNQGVLCQKPARSILFTGIVNS